MNIVTRFPPSPTGFLHIGRARTALFNYLFTQNHSGKMVFRIEDTDPERSKPEYEADIIECLRWLGITYDSGPFRQSERTAIYAKYIQKMIDSGVAYVSKEEPVEGERTRSEVIRFRNPKRTITFTDLIRGEVTFDTTDLGDFVIARSVNEPLYHLTVVIDDYEMGITHVIRGEDGISNTPRQILIQEGIGAPRPTYAHIPLILAADRSKLSGRHGAVSVSEYRRMGYLPEALLNYLCLLGWNPGTEQEIFSREEMIKAFDIAKVHKSGAIFNIDKLNWFNKQYILAMNDDSFIDWAKDEVIKHIHQKHIEDKDRLKEILLVVREKITTLNDIAKLFEPGAELSFVSSTGTVTRERLLWKKKPDPVAAKTHLEAVADILSAIPAAEWKADHIKKTVWPYVEKNGTGDVLWPLRMALTGLDRSPDPFSVAAILGAAETATRISAAATMLT